MNKRLKKAAALILCLTLLFSCALPVHAQEPDEPSVKLFYTDNAALRCSVLIFCWYSNTEDAAYTSYVTAGDVPDVTLEYSDADGTAKTIAIEKDKILQEVYGMESDTAAGQCMPQLTVCLPMYTVFLPDNARVRVSAGAFLTAGDKPFPNVCASISEFRSTGIYLKGTTEVLRDGNQTAVDGQQIELHTYVPDSWLDPIWTPHLELTDNGKPIDSKYALQGVGTHTVCASLNPFLFASFTIKTVSERKAFLFNTCSYGIGLWKATLLLLCGIVTLPLYFTGVPFFLSAYMLSGGLQGYASFFKSLFRTELLTQTYYFHEDKATIIVA